MRAHRPRLLKTAKFLSGAPAVESTAGGPLPLQEETGKIFAMIGLGMVGFSRYQLFAAGALLKWKSHFFILKPLNPVFCDLKSYRSCF
jgi:hypothetical protein